MARGQVETCMFCGLVACECNKPSPKKAIKSVPKSKVQPTVVPFASSVPERKGLSTSQQVRDAESDDKAFRDALVVMARGGLMSVDDMLKYEKVMNLSPTEFRTLVWKQRRAESQWQSQNS